ncbi:MAG: hypothetical protein ACM3ZA_08720 [Bacillota bacterium]
MPNRETEATQAPAPQHQDQSWRVFPETLDEPAFWAAQDITACYNHGRSPEESGDR